MRRLVIALAILAATLAIVDCLAWRRSQHRLLALAEESGLAQWRPGLGRELRRRTSPTRAKTLLAWQLIELETDRARLADLPAAERQEEQRRGIARLRLAERLAAQALPRSPASWQALAALGASRFLGPGREGRREAPAASWRRPLTAAIARAPHFAEPAILLASAELSRWSAISPAERDGAMPVLARALAQPRGLDLLLPAWIRLAPSWDRLLAPIPDRAAAWRRLGAEFRRAGDLERFAVAHERWRAALPALYAERLADARARQRGGDRQSALSLARSVLAAPHDLALADSFAAALAQFPAESAGGDAGDELRRWLRWALDLCLLDRCPLDEATLASLGRRAPGLAPVERALAALAGGEAPAASRPQPPAGDPGRLAWSPYWLYRAMRSAAREPAAARRALARAAGGESDELRRRLARLRLAEAAGDPAAVAAARRALAGLERDDGWPAERWLRRGRAYRLELIAASPRDGVRLEIPPAAAGAVIELHWDGRFIGAAALRRGESRHWRFPVAPGAHLVEVTSLTGRPLGPAGLRLGPRAG